MLPADGRPRSFALAADGQEAPNTQPSPQPRKYRRTEKALGPRWWRTRADPFAEVWEEIVACLAADPTRTGASLFADLQQRHPGQFADGQCRTLQRRVREWRAQRLLVFDERWFQEDALGAERLPRPLRVLSTDQADEMLLAHV